MNADEIIKNDELLSQLNEYKEEIKSYVVNNRFTYLEISNILRAKYKFTIDTVALGQYIRENRWSAFSRDYDDFKSQPHNDKDYFSNYSDKFLSMRGNPEKVKEYLSKQDKYDYLFYKYCFYHHSAGCFNDDKIDHIDQHRNIFFVDGDENNILTSNLELLCNDCMEKEKKNSIYPYMNVSITHELQYGHRLPEYGGKCYFAHGHRGVITLVVRRRLDPESGFAIDFNEFKKIVKERIDNILDHEWLNNYIPNPTTEYSLIWLWEHLSPYLKGIERITWSEGSKTAVTLEKRDMLDSLYRLGIEYEWLNEYMKKGNNF